jgi:hypothetical protein
LPVVQAGDERQRDAAINGGEQVAQGVGEHEGVEPVVLEFAGR